MPSRAPHNARTLVYAANNQNADLRVTKPQNDIPKARNNPRTLLRRIDA
jgi:hypothetical protein